ncbi:MAG TPA: hypothetical protein VM369_04940 [Candidatus Binatia bacterium]|nr:hypothetical protein [Candidatus Binatia bacterium]
MKPAVADRIHAAAMALTALGTIAFWIVFYTSGENHVREDEVYFAFEHSFVLADSWMALFFLLAAWNLVRARPIATLFGICAGAMMLFLGSMDLLFNLQQHTFAVMSEAMIAECVIVAYSWVFGPVTVWRMWGHPLRREGE